MNEVDNVTREVLMSSDGVMIRCEPIIEHHVIDFKFQPEMKNCLLGKKNWIKTKYKMAEKSQSPLAEESFEENLKPTFRWDKEERVNSLIQCMLSCRSEIEFEGKDFSADKVMIYESVRQKMAKIYVYELSSFGLLNLERYSFMGRDDIL